MGAPAPNLAAARPARRRAGRSSPAAWPLRRSVPRRSRLPGRSTWRRRNEPSGRRGVTRAGRTWPGSAGARRLRCSRRPAGAYRSRTRSSRCTGRASPRRSEGLSAVAREAELVGAACCPACRADNGRTFRIADELRTPRLPHPDCPRGLCACDWWPAVRKAPKKRRDAAGSPRPAATPTARLTSPNRPARLRRTSRIAGDDRDEYPSRVGTETRWLVETGTTAAVNGPGSLRTERRGRGSRPVGSGAGRQR